MQAVRNAVSAIRGKTFVTGIDGKIDLSETVARVAAGKGIHPQEVKIRRGSVMGEKESQVIKVAQELFSQQPDWVTFFREVLGVGGIVRDQFTSPEALAQFEQSEEYNEIQQMVAKLRERGDETANSREPTRVITVRLPASLHESLRAEAHDRHTSMNKLCITKLLQMVESELVPTDSKLPIAVRA
jgi:predicted HicB family RNase H-like nuclease